MDTSAGNVLRQAATLALAAPSIFNTQPWTWRLDRHRLELHADRTRQLLTVDPDGRLLTVSCGAALHHALVGLHGASPHVTLLPDDAEPDLLAALSLDAEEPAAAAQSRLRQAIPQRRTDRRAYLQIPVAPAVIADLAAAGAAQGAELFVVPWHHIDTLIQAALRAGALQLSDPDYRHELADWTHRPPWSGDGVPLNTAVPAVARRVPVRDFAAFGGATMPAGTANDLGAVYGIIHTDGDEARDWLQAGMALSAVLLTATAAGLATAPISDVTEVRASRRQLNDLVSGRVAQVAVRVGHAPAGDVPAAPRRLADDVIEVVKG